MQRFTSVDARPRPCTHALADGAHDRAYDGGELTEIILFREWQLPGSHFRPVSDGCWPDPAFRSEPSLLMTDAAW